MLLGMWKATLRGLFARRLRLVLTLAAIVLGVAFVSATYVLTDTLSAVIDHLFIDAASNVDVTVRSASAFGDNAGLSADRARIPESVLDSVRGVPSVKEADGMVLGFATIVKDNGAPLRPRAGPGPRTVVARRARRSAHYASTTGRHRAVRARSRSTCRRRARGTCTPAIGCGSCRRAAPSRSASSAR